MELSSTHICGAICGGEPHEETHRRQDGEPRWCFVCRKKQQFDYVIMSPIFDMENPSYHGPVPSIRCAICDTYDGDVFPGSEREWEDA